MVEKMKITFEWNYDHISCNTCPFSRLGSIDYAVYCTLTDERVIAADQSDYDFNNPNQRGKECPLSINEESS